MSLNPKPIEEYSAEMEEDNDSFHSFAQSDTFSDEFDNLSNIDDDDGNDTITEDFEANMAIPNATTSYSCSSCSSADVLCTENSPNIANCVEVSPNKLKELFDNQVPGRPRFTDHYQVPKPRCDSPMPCLGAFNMDDPKLRNEAEAPSIEEKEKEALQKYAFTEIWVERQQYRNRSLRRHFSIALQDNFVKEDSNELKEQLVEDQQKGATNEQLEGQQYSESHNRSLNSHFAAALENYFVKEETNELKKQTDVEKQKGAINKQLFVDPDNSTAVSTSFQTVSDAQPYVSPFEDMPPVPKEKKLPGEKSYITVPAGFDLTNLVEYKNPDHWHRRSTTRYDSRP
ncbi:hypothetical protein KR044_011802 [Drosophila immigrans]|nr:hypothetical protein KR044_011802 [Drosophila immigrans]